VPTQASIQYRDVEWCA